MGRERSPFAVLDAVSGSLTHVMVLGAEHWWIAAPGQEVAPEVVADLIGLRLGATDDDESSWGTRYGPWATFESNDGKQVEAPSREEITPELVNIWERRARSARHPALRHRYADLVWDLAALVRGTRAPVEFAWLAIDSVVFGYAVRRSRRALRAWTRAVLAGRNPSPP